MTTTTLQTENSIVDISEFSFDLAINGRNSFLRNLRSIKCLLIFDKSKSTTDVHCILINPFDKLSFLQNTTFKISIQPLKDLVYYRVIVFNKRIYIIGGLSLKTNKLSSKVYTYDLETNIWKECANLNTPRCKFSVEVIRNIIYVFGGKGQNGSLASVEFYDSTIDKWREATFMAKPRELHATCLLNDAYLIFSGGFKIKTDNFSVLDTNYPDWKKQILTLNMPVERENHKMVQLNNFVYLIGGMRYKNEEYNEMEQINVNTITYIDMKQYKITNKNWRTKTSLKTSQDRNGCATVVLGKYIYIIGGHSVSEGNNSKESRLIERIDTTTNRIEKLFHLNDSVFCYDVDCCIIDIDSDYLLNFNIDSLFFTNLPSLW